MIKYINQSGQEVEINDTPANIQAAEKAGWVEGSTKEAKARIAKKDKTDKEDSKFFKAQSKIFKASEKIVKADKEAAEIQKAKDKDETKARYSATRKAKAGK